MDTWGGGGRKREREGRQSVGKQKRQERIKEKGKDDKGNKSGEEKIAGGGSGGWGKSIKRKQYDEAESLVGNFSA